MKSRALHTSLAVFALIGLCGCAASRRESGSTSKLPPGTVTDVGKVAPAGELTDARYVPAPPRPTVAPAKAPLPPAAAWPDSIPRPRYGERTAVDVKEEPVVRAAPSYPQAAREAGVQGTVIVGALVGIDGRVHDVITLQSVPMLDEAARTAVRQWAFKPAMVNGKPVPVWTDVPVKFSLH